MKLIAGLGNPGIKYETTRHNTGFITVDLIADHFNTECNLKGIACLYNTFMFQGEKVVLVKPQTYMNESGLCVGQVARYYKIEPKDVLIISDDISLPCGTMRFRPKGSSGGHNGLKSVASHLGTEEFPRLKIGIGYDSNVIDYVLGHFSKAEWDSVSAMMSLAVDAVKLWIAGGEQEVMNKYNKYSKLPKSENNPENQNES